MAEDVLPSYQDAVGRPDWLAIVEPYVPLRECYRLCLVNRRFWEHFAPRLWGDPIRSIRLLGYLESDDEESNWYRTFVSKARKARPVTQRLVHTLDMQGFSTSASKSVTGNHGHIARSMNMLPMLFPNLTCLILDGQNYLDLSIFEALQRPAAEESDDWNISNGPRLLSLSRCVITTAAKRMLHSPYLQDLVYIDFSHRAAQSLFKGITSAHIPSLRIVKARESLHGNQDAVDLLKVLGGRVWALDLSENELDGQIVDYLQAACYNGRALPSDAFFASEGKVSTTCYGGCGIADWDSENPKPANLCFSESDCSPKFNHPELFFVDTPPYQLSFSPENPARWDGGARTLSAALEDVATLLVEDSTGLQAHDLTHQRTLSHLFLDGNSLTATDIKRLMVVSGGWLEHLEVDRVEFAVKDPDPPEQEAASGSKPLAKKQEKRPGRLHGMLGLAHVFRPALACNLNTLRVHHSLVTQIPAFTNYDVPGVAANGLALIYLAETVIRSRVEMLLPLPFVPNMNPRITNITLTCIPRRSSGPLIDALIRFLRLASEQERAIVDARLSESGHRLSPRMVKGLRRITLEFEPDPMTDLDNIVAGLNDDSGADDSDDDDDQPAEDFSFFGNSWSTSEATRKTITANTTPNRKPGAAKVAPSLLSSRAAGKKPELPFPCSPDAEGHVRHYDADLEAQTVWVGPAPQSARPLSPALPPPTLTITAASEQFTSPPPPPPPPASSQPQATRRHPLWRGFIAPSPAQPPPPSPSSLTATTTTSQRPTHHVRSWSAPAPPPPATEAVKAYQQSIAQRGGLSTFIEHASPSHVAAGARPHSLIDVAAWHGAVWPDKEDLRVEGKRARREMARMRDVYAAVKQFRFGTKKAYERCRKEVEERNRVRRVAWEAEREERRQARRLAGVEVADDEDDGERFVPDTVPLGVPHWHWTGRLRLVSKEESVRYLESSYWR